jgi:hypothetical protein
MKKIALCFSGGIRNSESSIPSIYKYIINNLKKKYEVDTFFYLTYISDLNNIEQKFKMRKSSFNKDKLLKFFQPKKYEIIEYNNQLQKKEMNIDGFDCSNVPNLDKKYSYNAVGMFAKIWKCNQFKKKYEEENNFKYDYVFRCRLDYIFLDNLEIDIDENIQIVNDRFTSRSKIITNDKFFGSTSKIMDDLCDIYKIIPNYIKNKIFIEGQGLIIKRLDEISKKYNVPVKKIGHRNTYYKCQGRHSITNKNFNILVDFKDKILNNWICYFLLYQGYKVYNLHIDHELSIFNNYYLFDDNIKFNLVISNEIKNFNTNINLILINDKFDNNLIDNFNLFFFYQIDNLKYLGKIINRFVQMKKKYRVYELNQIIKPEIGDKVIHYIPDRGLYGDKITQIKNNKYGFENDNYSLYKLSEIEIINLEKYIKCYYER